MPEDKGKALLENAYNLETPEDNAAYYAALSSDYDSHFAEGLGFALPMEVARIFRASKPSSGPIADIGCGTGLVGEALSNEKIVVDGFDISTEMLAIARDKNIYRDLFQLDLTKDVSDHAGKYSGLVSSGTFTHGHLGPEVVSRVLEMGCTGAICVFSINLVHFKRLGFETKFERLIGEGIIQSFRAEDVAIYSKQGHDHSSDRAAIVSFVKS